jgi:hypothetical protein
MECVIYAHFSAKTIKTGTFTDLTSFAGPATVLSLGSLADTWVSVVATACSEIST